MTYKHSATLIEKIAEKLRIIPGLHEEESDPIASLTEPGKLTKFPPP